MPVTTWCNGKMCGQREYHSICLENDQLCDMTVQTALVLMTWLVHMGSYDVVALATWKIYLRSKERSYFYSKVGQVLNHAGKDIHLTIPVS